MESVVLRILKNETEKGIIHFELENENKNLILGFSIDNYHLKSSKEILEEMVKLVNYYLFSLSLYNTREDWKLRTKIRNN